jgi:hypothetical protein
MVPIECGLDLSMFDDGNDIDAQIAAFEEQNDFGVYIYEWKQHFHNGTLVCAHPLVLREPNRLHAQEVVLLLWKKHYVLVTNFHSFMGGKTETTLKTAKGSTSQLFCHRCGLSFRSDRGGKQKFEDHVASCDPWKLERPEARRETYLPVRGPSGPPAITFQQHHALVDVPCFVCFDMECYRNGDSLAHVASFAYAAVGSDVYTVPEEHRYRVFKNRSDNPVECVIEGIKSLQELWKDLKAKSQQHPNHKLTDEEEEDFQSATQCYLCEKVSDQLVREHCHFTGAYRGAACEKCNASLRLRSLPCYAHNYQGFDNGAIIRALAQMDTTRQPNVINRTAERQLCCSWENLSFRDSMSLMSGSLGKLIESARGKLEGEALAERFQLMAERHPYCGDANDLSLLLRKLPFPLISPACFDKD